MEARPTEALNALPAIAQRANSPELSARQLEVLVRVIAGDGVDEIASKLYLSASTVRNHLAAIYRKFGVHSRADLLAALLRATAVGS